MIKHKKRKSNKYTSRSLTNLSRNSLKAFLEKSKKDGIKVIF